jgi:DnaJ-class molecular chaperone
MKGGGRGDAYVEVRVAVPKTLSPDQREIIETLREKGL